MDATTEMVTLSKITTEVYRKGEGPTVLFIQGAGAGKAAWYPIIDRLAGRMHCVTFDNRGTGKASNADDSLTVRDMAEDAAEFITTHYGGSPVHVVGVSMGSRISATLAFSHPELVKSLILHSAAPSRAPRSQDQGDFREELLNHGVPVQVLRRFVALFAEGAGGLDFELPESVNNPDSFSEQNFRAHMNAVRGHVITDEELALIAAPTLLTVGSDDISTMPAGVRHMHRCIAGSKMVTVEDGGHGYYLAEPDLVATLTGGWVLQHERQSA